jgi:hypothetical protein
VIQDSFNSRELLQEVSRNFDDETVNKEDVKHLFSVLVNSIMTLSPKEKLVVKMLQL